MAAKRGRKTAGELEKVESLPSRPEPPGDLSEWDELEPMDKCRMLKQREVETRAALSVATKLRITKQSTVLPDKSKKPDKPSVPWRTRS